MMRTILLALFLLPITALALTDAIDDQPTEVVFSGGQMTVHFDSAFSDDDQTKLKQWLKVSAEAVSTLYGRFPVSQFHVHLKSNTYANEPVPWGEVWKNGQYKVLFQVNPHYSLEEFVDDWTAPHEFSHLIHPYPGNGNSWFGEGLASYYQNILRIRQGSYSEKRAWQKLFEGLQRGEKQAKQNGLTLLDASKHMRNTHSFMHVYWGGMLYFLTVDMRLRQETTVEAKGEAIGKAMDEINGKEGRKSRESLDTAWHKFQKCCLSINSNWPVEKLISKLDQLTGTSIFSEEYKKQVHRKGFGDYYTTLNDLGITIINNQVQLSHQDSPAVNLRTSIGSTSIR